MIDNDLKKTKKESKWSKYVFPFTHWNPREAYEAFESNPASTWWLDTLETIANKPGGYRQYVPASDFGRIAGFKHEWLGHIAVWKQFGLNMHKSTSQSTLENILRKFETNKTDVQPYIRNVDFFRTPNREKKSQVASKKKINQSNKKNKTTNGGFQVVLPENSVYLSNENVGFAVLTTNNKRGHMIFTPNGMTFHLPP